MYYSQSSAEEVKHASSKDGVDSHEDLALSVDGLLKNASPGEVVALPDGRKIIVGIDWEWTEITEDNLSGCSFDDWRAVLAEELGHRDGDASHGRYLHVKPTEAWRIRFFPELLQTLPRQRVVRHYWFGQKGYVAGDWFRHYSVICPAMTGKAMLARQPDTACALCDLHKRLTEGAEDWQARIAQMIKPSLEWHVPVLPLEWKENEAAHWQPAPWQIRMQPHMLRMVGYLFLDLYKIADSQEDHSDWMTSLQSLTDWYAGCSFVVARDALGRWSIAQVPCEPVVNGVKAWRSFERKLRLSPASVSRLNAKSPEELQELADLISTTNGRMPTTGRAAEIVRVFRHPVTLVPVAWGTKWPVRHSYPDRATEWMSDSRHYYPILD